MICQLQNKRIRCIIDTNGATILALQIDDIDVLQSCENKTKYIKDETGGFPLVPIANRVQNNQYTLYDETIYLSKTSLDNSEYLHGNAWISNWSIQSHTDDFLVLTLESNGEIEEHYNFISKFSIKLNKDNVDFNLSVKHIDESNYGRLYGIGIHPYFAIDLEDELLINALGYCKACNENYLLCDPSCDFDPKFDYRSFKKINDIFCNHAYVACNGALIKRNKYNTMFKLTSSCSNLMMYHQKQKPFIALEPQTHLVNGVNKKEDRGGMILLNKYFNTLSMTMNIAKIK